MNLDSLAQHYKIAGNDTDSEMDALAKRYREGRFRTLTEAMACSVGVMGLNLGEGFDPASLPPQMTEAFQLAFPNLDIQTVGEYSGEQLTGLLTAWKGKLFEVSVRDRLNNGEWVGDLQLAPGQTAELAESVTQPGWDLQILSADGTIAEQIQLKATDYLSYVEHALNRYPEYQVLATTELTAHQDTTAGLIVSDISDGQLEADLAGAVADAPTEFLALGLPLLPIALNAYWVASGKRTVAEAATGAAASTAAIYAGNLVGDVLTEAAGELISDALVGGAVSLLADVVATGGLGLLFGWIFRGLTKPSQPRQQVPTIASRHNQKQADAINAFLAKLKGNLAALEEMLRSLSTAPPPTRAT